MASGSPKTKLSASRRSARQWTSSSPTRRRTRPPDRSPEEARRAIRQAAAEPRRAGVLARVLGGGTLALLRAARLPWRQRAEHRRLAGALSAVRPLHRGAPDKDPRAGSEPALV